METKICKRCGRELPSTMFRTGMAHGTPFVVSICEDCMKERQREGRAKRKQQKALSHAEEVEQARNLRLRDFTPRELMEELNRRGYTGKLKFVEVHEIDIENF